MRKCWWQRTHPDIPRKMINSHWFKNRDCLNRLFTKEDSRVPHKHTTVQTQNSGATLWPKKQNEVSRKSVNQHTYFKECLASHIEVIETCITYSPANPHLSMKQQERYVCTHTRKPSVNVFTGAFSRRVSSEMWPKCPSTIELAKKMCHGHTPWIL